MRQHRVAICGLCRDVRPELPRFSARVERLGGMFAGYQAVFYENDSSDGTREFLSAWAMRNPAIHVVSERPGLPRFGQIPSLERAAVLARHRNRYRELVLTKCGDPDFVIVVDSDLKGGWSEEGIAHTFGHDDWDYVGSYGLAVPGHPARARPDPLRHFDTWAFRAAGPSRSSRTMDPGRLTFERGEPMLPVLSCFGGLGIYRTACLHAADYDGSDCEHVALHRKMRAAGFDRLFLNPSQIVLYDRVGP